MLLQGLESVFMKEKNQYEETKMLSPIQDKLLSMLSWFHEYCESNHITYYAAGGTMIGALRHEGFIPWDDDIDIVVPRNDYNRLIQLFNHKIDHYILESPYSGNDDYLYSFAKLYDTDTTLTEKTHIPCRRGVYIDVFPLDGVGMTKEEALSNFKSVDKKNMMLMTRTCSVRRERSWYKNVSIILSQAIPKAFINNKKLSIQLDEIANAIHNNDAQFVANLMGTYREKEIIEKHIFGKPTLYKFEHIYIYGPEKYDMYLQKIYGEWRKLPPIEKQKTNHDFIELDLSSSYFR